MNNIIEQMLNKYDIKNTNDECFCYFDLKRNDFRQFLRSNFVEIKEKKE